MSVMQLCSLCGSDEVVEAYCEECSEEVLTYQNRQIDILQARVEALEYAGRKALEDGEFSLYSNAPDLLRAALAGQEEDKNGL